MSMKKAPGIAWLASRGGLLSTSKGDADSTRDG